MRTPCLVLCLLASCSGGGGGTPIPSVNVPAELVVCRSERDSPGQGTLRTATRRGLADKRLADAAGVESDVRIHPDGIRIVFARERRGNDADSREIFTGTVDGSALERRLTTNDDRDDSPCWNSDGTKILFSSNRGGRRRIWSMALDGTDADPLFDDGSEQTDPDARGGLVCAHHRPYSPADQERGQRRGRARARRRAASTAGAPAARRRCVQMSHPPARTTPLEELRECLRISLSRIGAPVIATDTDNRITFLNPEAESLTG